MKKKFLKKILLLLFSTIVKQTKELKITKYFTEDNEKIIIENREIPFPKKLQIEPLITLNKKTPEELKNLFTLKNSFDKLEEQVLKTPLKEEIVKIIRGTNNEIYALTKTTIQKLDPITLSFTPPTSLKIEETHEIECFDMTAWKQMDLIYIFCKRFNDKEFPASVIKISQKNFEDKKNPILAIGKLNFFAINNLKYTFIGIKKNTTMILGYEDHPLTEEEKRTIIQGGKSQREIVMIKEILPETGECTFEILKQKYSDLEISSSLSKLEKFIGVRFLSIHFTYPTRKGRKNGLTAVYEYFEETKKKFFVNSTHFFYLISKKNLRFSSRAFDISEVEGEKLIYQNLILSKELRIYVPENDSNVAKISLKNFNYRTAVINTTEYKEEKNSFSLKNIFQNCLITEFEIAQKFIFLECKTFTGSKEADLKDIIIVDIEHKTVTHRLVKQNSFYFSIKRNLYLINKSGYSKFSDGNAYVLINQPNKLTHSIFLNFEENGRSHSQIELNLVQTEIDPKKGYPVNIDLDREKIKSRIRKKFKNSSVEISLSRKFIKGSNLRFSFKDKYGDTYYNVQDCRVQTDFKNHHLKVSSDRRFSSKKKMKIIDVVQGVLNLNPDGITYEMNFERFNHVFMSRFNKEENHYFLSVENFIPKIDLDFYIEEGDVKLLQYFRKNIFMIVEKFGKIHMIFITFKEPEDREKNPYGEYSTQIQIFKKHQKFEYFKAIDFGFKHALGIYIEPPTSKESESCEEKNFFENFSKEKKTEKKFGKDGGKVKITSMFLYLTIPSKNEITNLSREIASKKKLKVEKFCPIHVETNTFFSQSETPQGIFSEDYGARKLGINIVIFSKCEGEKQFTVFFKPSSDSLDDFFMPFSDEIFLENDPKNFENICLVDNLLIYESDQGLEVYKLNSNKNLVKKINYFSESQSVFLHFQCFPKLKKIVTIVKKTEEWGYDRIKFFDISKEGIENPNRRLIFDLKKYNPNQRFYVISYISSEEEEEPKFIFRRIEKPELKVVSAFMIDLNLKIKIESQKLETQNNQKNPEIKKLEIGIGIGELKLKDFKPTETVSMSIEFTNYPLKIGKKNLNKTIVNPYIQDDNNPKKTPDKLEFNLKEFMNIPQNVIRVSCNLEKIAKISILSKSPEYFYLKGNEPPLTSRPFSFVISDFVKLPKTLVWNNKLEQRSFNLKVSKYEGRIHMHHITEDFKLIGFRGEVDIANLKNISIGYPSFTQKLNLLTFAKQLNSPNKFKSRRNSFPISIGAGEWRIHSLMAFPKKKNFEVEKSYLDTVCLLDIPEDDSVIFMKLKLSQTYIKKSIIDFKEKIEDVEFVQILNKKFKGEEKNLKIFFNKYLLLAYKRINDDNEINFLFFNIDESKFEKNVKKKFLKKTKEKIMFHEIAIFGSEIHIAFQEKSQGYLTYNRYSLESEKLQITEKKILNEPDQRILIPKHHQVSSLKFKIISTTMNELAEEKISLYVLGHHILHPKCPLLFEYKILKEDKVDGYLISKAGISCEEIKAEGRFVFFDYFKKNNSFLLGVEENNGFLGTKYITFGAFLENGYKVEFPNYRGDKTFEHFIWEGIIVFDIASSKQLKSEFFSDKDIPDYKERIFNVQLLDIFRVKKDEKKDIPFWKKLIFIGIIVAGTLMLLFFCFKIMKCCNKNQDPGDYHGLSLADSVSLNHSFVSKATRFNKTARELRKGKGGRKRFKRSGTYGDEVKRGKGSFDYVFKRKIKSKKETKNMDVIIGDFGYGDDF